MSVFARNRWGGRVIVRGKESQRQKLEGKMSVAESEYKFERKRWEGE